MYDPVTQTERQVVNPELEMENHSRYRESYFKLMRTVPKPFNKKIGQFTYFTEKSKTELDKQKAERDIEREKNPPIRQRLVRKSLPSLKMPI